jgi:hypothetical protein
MEPSYASAGEDGSFDPLHPQCCADDEYCGKHRRCIHHGCTYDNPTGCWLDEQCAPGELCSGAFLCDCGVICHSRTLVGTCVPSDAGCCRANDDCPNGSPCLKGRCMVITPAEERCWSDRDCVSDRGGQCESPTVCPCGKECDDPDVPGYCTYLLI